MHNVPGRNGLDEECPPALDVAERRFSVCRLPAIASVQGSDHLSVSSWLVTTEP